MCTGEFLFELQIFDSIWPNFCDGESAWSTLGMSHVRAGILCY